MRLFSRNGVRLERRFPLVARAIARLPVEQAVLDGEIRVHDAEGRTRFQLIQPRIHVSDPVAIERLARELPATYYVFDALHLDGRDLRGLPFEARKRAAAALVPEEGLRLRYSDHVARRGADLFALACGKGLDGVIAKRADAPYVEARSRAWLKVKCGGWAHFESPDFAIIDLDPGDEVGFERVIEALLVREVLRELGLRGCPKTSGATGIHVQVPLEPGYRYEDARILARIVATMIEERRPDLATTVRGLKERPRDRIYVDYLQNVIGKTVVGPYSLREYPKAPVSTPLRWEEVRPGLRPERFHMKDVPARVRREGDLWRPMLEDRQRIETVPGRGDARAALRRRRRRREAG